MARVLLDTNSLLDFLSTARPEHDLAVRLVRRLQDCHVAAFAVATSLKDVYYILGRSDGEPAARRAVESILATMIVLPVDESCCRAALASSEPDFEDGLIRAAAEAARVDFIISRDARAFVGSRVPRLSPADALVELGHARRS